MTFGMQIAGIRLGVISLVILLLAGCTTQLSPARKPTGNQALDAIYFPPDSKDGKWQTITPTEAGFDEAALEEALSYAEAQRSSGVVVLFDGRILAERYWKVPKAEGDGAEPGYDEQSFLRR